MRSEVRIGARLSAPDAGRLDAPEDQFTPPELPAPALRGDARELALKRGARRPRYRDLE